MIQANELRIGNWIEAVADMGNYQMKMTEHNFTSVARNPNCVNPIPLTPEIEKCGFEKGVETHGFKNWYIKHLGFVLCNAPNDSENPNDWYLKVDIDKPNYICCIKYLHQLQNLYFALTNTELNFKP
jgi:hypothetical protein